jgi:hypothetical protein
VVLRVPVLHEQLVDLFRHLARPVEPLDVHGEHVALGHFELLDLTDVERLRLVSRGLDEDRVAQAVLGFVVDAQVAVDVARRTVAPNLASERPLANLPKNKNYIYARQR